MNGNGGGGGNVVDETVVYACFVRRREKGKIKPRKVKRIKIPLSSDCQSISDGAKT